METKRSALLLFARLVLSEREGYSSNLRVYITLKSLFFSIYHLCLTVSCLLSYVDTYDVLFLCAERLERKMERDFTKSEHA